MSGSYCEGMPDVPSADDPPCERTPATEADGRGFVIDAAQRLVTVRLAGDIVFAELCELIDALLNDAAFDPRYAVLVDIRVVLSLPSELATRKLALDRLAAPNDAAWGPIAFVAMTRLGLQFALELEAFLDQPEERVRVFTASPAARAWLGVT